MWGGEGEDLDFIVDDRLDGAEAEGGRWARGGLLPLQCPHRAPTLLVYPGPPTSPRAPLHIVRSGQWGAQATEAPTLVLPLQSPTGVPWGCQPEGTSPQGLCGTKRRAGAACAQAQGKTLR